MAAASVDLPAVMVTGWPILNGKYQGRSGLGHPGLAVRGGLAAGPMTPEECSFAEGCMARSAGHCMTMGTASTMASMAEALGLQLPYSATWLAMTRAATRPPSGPASWRSRWSGRPPAVGDYDPRGVRERDPGQRGDGGSTNAVIHLLALAGRLGVTLSLDDFDALARDVPTLVDLQPTVSS